MEHIAALKAKFNSTLALNDEVLMVLLNDVVTTHAFPREIAETRDTDALRVWVTHTSLKTTGIAKQLATRLLTLFDEWDDSVWDDLQPLLLALV